MAFHAMLRKSPSIFAAFGSRLVRGGRRNYNAALLAAALSHRAGLSKKNATTVVLPFPRNYSTAAETGKPSSAESLLRVIESEIKVAQETDDHDRVEEIPKGFPFKIEDNVGQQTIMLTREYDGELVKVEVYMPDLVTGERNDIDDDNDIEKPTQSSIPLVVSVSKKSGISLEFSCIAYPDEIAIDSLSVKTSQASEDQIAYGGPSFQDLDENLRNAFHKYLEIRGIKPSTANCLQEYMINKDSREYLYWLKNLKKFVQA